MSDSRKNLKRSKSFYADKLLLNKYLALPLFLLIMCFVFFMTFETADVLLKEPLSHGINRLADAVSYFLYEKGVNPMLHALIIQGVFPGVGSVLSFVPVIAALFFFLAVLESCGYMERAAFIFHKPMNAIGLTGKAAVPLISGFGCSVPAIMAASSLSPMQNKKLAIAMIPFISCSAKLPIYIIFIDTFFKSNGIFALCGVYAFGMLCGICYILVLKKLFKISGAPKLASNNCIDFSFSRRELSPYRCPSMKYVCSQVYQNSMSFIKKAFTIIFAASILVWFLENFSLEFQPVSAEEDSILAHIAEVLAPVFRPLGFGDSRAVSALLTGLCAKESVAGTFNILAQCGNFDSVSLMLSEIFTPISAFAFMAFCLLYAPCIASLTAMRNVFGSWKYPVYAFIFHNMGAWAAAFVIFNAINLIWEASV